MNAPVACPPDSAQDPPEGATVIDIPIGAVVSDVHADVSGYAPVSTMQLALSNVWKLPAHVVPVAAAQLHPVQARVSLPPVKYTCCTEYALPAGHAISPVASTQSRGRKGARGGATHTSPATHESSFPSAVVEPQTRAERSHVTAGTSFVVSWVVHVPMSVGAGGVEITPRALAPPTFQQDALIG